MKFTLPGKSGFSFSKLAVGVQFFMSLVLIICTLVVYKQLHFINTFDLGFDKKNIIIADLPDNNADRYNRFKSELLKNPAIKQGEQLKLVCNFKTVDTSFLNLYGIKLIAGRNLTSYDSLRCILVNEEVSRMAGYKNSSEIIGKQAEYWGRKVEIVGVVKDLHPRTLQEKVRPVCLHLDPNDYGEAGILLNINKNFKNSESQLKETVQYIEEQWKNIYTDKNFNFYFLDERVNSFYKNEQNTAKLLDIFSIIAVFICCMGLFGITYYLAERKSKEIAVRLVNGASIGDVLKILSNSYIPWLITAFAVSIPITVYAMNIWLEQYAYKTELSWWLFVLAGMLAFVIALLTVFYQAWRAASRNPVEALRYE